MIKIIKQITYISLFLTNIIFLSSCNLSEDDSKKALFEKYGLCFLGCIDEDSDGYGRGPSCLGPDCDDSDPDINPASSEICGNNIDDNCDFEIDENCFTDCIDTDGDGFGIGPDCPLVDCYDNASDPLSANVFPGQTDFFESSYANGNWDYNCDGVAEKQYGHHLQCIWDGTMCTGSGFIRFSSLPTCGNTGTFITCGKSDISCTENCSCEIINVQHYIYQKCR